MIDWHLITRRVSSNCLMSQIKSKETPSAHTDFLCHTQAVERHIKFIFNFFFIFDVILQAEDIVILVSMHIFSALPLKPTQKPEKNAPLIK